MENLNPSPELIKKKEYEALERKATRNGHLENIHTHESNDIIGIMNYSNRKQTPDSIARNNVLKTNPGRVGLNNNPTAIAGSGI